MGIHCLLKHKLKPGVLLTRPHNLKIKTSKSFSEHSGFIYLVSYIHMKKYVNYKLGLV